MGFISDLLNLTEKQYEYNEKIRKADKLIKDASEIKPEFITVKSYEYNDSAVFLKLAEIYESEEFQWFMQGLESAAVRDMEDLKGIEMKGIYLMGIRKVSQQLSTSRNTYNKMTAKVETYEEV